jgi:hypothetical protein
VVRKTQILFIHSFSFVINITIIKMIQININLKQRVESLIADGRDRHVNNLLWIERGELCQEQAGLLGDGSVGQNTFKLQDLLDLLLQSLSQTVNHYLTKHHSLKTRKKPKSQIMHTLFLMLPYVTP